jgi:hypothetical protein
MPRSYPFVGIWANDELYYEDERVDKTKEARDTACDFVAKILEEELQKFREETHF